MCFFETKRLCVNSGMIKMTDIWHLMCRPHWSRRTQTRRYAFILSKILRLLTFACRAQIYQLFCRTGSLCPKYCASSPLLAGLGFAKPPAKQAQRSQDLAGEDVVPPVFVCSCWAVAQCEDVVTPVVVCSCCAVAQC